MKFVYETCKKLDYNPFFGLDIDAVCDNVKNFSKTIMNTLYKVDWTFYSNGKDTATLIKSIRLYDWISSLNIKLDVKDSKKGKVIRATRKSGKKSERIGSYKLTGDFDLERDVMKLILRTYD